MITLHGFSSSNYYNKVKLALLEKNVQFNEDFVFPADKAMLAHSPLGKVPYISTPEGSVCESYVIMDYIEDRYPTPALLPEDSFARAKVREISLYLELHIELVARRLYTEAFFGGKVSDSVKAKTGEELRRNVPALFQLCKFTPFIAGDTFTMADCAAIVHFPLLSLATKVIYGEDILANTPAKEYLKAMATRPHVNKVREDQKASQAAFNDYVKARSAKVMAEKIAEKSDQGAQ